MPRQTAPLAVIPMPEVIDIEEVDGLYRVNVLDTLGNEFAVYFAHTVTAGYRISSIRLPKDSDWDVGVFQEMIGVRDEAVEYFKDNGYDVPDASFDLAQVHHYADDPQLDAEAADA